MNKVFAVNIFGAIAVILLSVTVHAAPRIISDEAVISVAGRSPKVSLDGSFTINRLSIDESAFNSLNRRKISRFAARVRSARTLSHHPEGTAVAYWKSRNPCNEPTIKRLLRKDPSLRCEPNFEFQSDATINDPYESYLYALDGSSTGRIRAREAWDLSTGSSDVVVGIIDTGTDYTHPDLAANIWVNPGEVASNGIDDDHNGYIDDVHGIDTFNNDSDPMDDHYHGTHVAGTIGAVGNNGVGVAGVNWTVKMIPCKFLGSTGSGSTSGAIECVEYLTNLKLDGVNVVATNNSWGGGGYSQALYDSIDRAKSAGIGFITSAGNSSSNNDSTAYYPANYNVSNVVTVAAIDQNGDLASFSSYGASSVDLAAPGVSILSTYPGNQYAYLSGTSMAAPHVTGVYALMRAYTPSLSMSSTIASLLAGGVSLSSLSGKTITGKTLNAYGALTTTVVEPTATPTSTPTSVATPRATPIPTIAPTASPTATPTPTPTPTPEKLRSNEARIALSAKKSGSKIAISCKITARSNAKKQHIKTTLAGYKITLRNSLGAQRGQALSNSSGAATFSLSAAQAKQANRCLAMMGDGRTISSGYVRVVSRN